LTIHLAKLMAIFWVVQNKIVEELAIMEIHAFGSQLVVGDAVVGLYLAGGWANVDSGSGYLFDHSGMQFHRLAGIFLDVYRLAICREVQMFQRIQT